MLKTLFDYGKVCACLIFLFKNVAAEKIIKTTQCDKFTLSCREGEVFLMTNATYGRMAYGDCIEPDERNLGYENDNKMFKCSTNILNYMHQKCSGKKICNVTTGEIFLDHRGVCDLPGYVELEYKCLKSYAQSCTINASKIPIIISKFIPPSCRSLEVRATPGKSIEIVPMFGYGPEQETSLNNLYIGNIVDMEHKLIERIEAKTILTTKVQIKIIMQITLLNWMLNITEKDICPNAYFQNFTIVIKKTTSNVTLKCELTGETWTLSCDDKGQWMGENKNCTVRTGNIPTNSFARAYSDLIVVSIVSAVVVITIGATCLVFYSFKKGRMRNLKERRGRKADATEFEYKDGDRMQDVDCSCAAIACKQRVEPAIAEHPATVGPHYAATMAAKTLRAPYVSDSPYAKKIPFQAAVLQQGMSQQQQKRYQNAMEIQPYTADCSCYTMQYRHRLGPPGFDLASCTLQDARRKESPYHFGRVPMNQFYYPTLHVPINPYSVDMCYDEEAAPVYNTLESFAIPAAFDPRVHQMVDPIGVDQPTDLTMGRKKLTLSREDVIAAERTPWEEIK